MNYVDRHARVCFLSLVNHGADRAEYSQCLFVKMSFPMRPFSFCFVFIR